MTEMRFGRICGVGIDLTNRRSVRAMVMSVLKAFGWFVCICVGLVLVALSICIINLIYQSRPIDEQYETKEALLREPRARDVLPMQLHLPDNASRIHMKSVGRYGSAKANLTAQTTESEFVKLAVEMNYPLSTNTFADTNLETHRLEPKWYYKKVFGDAPVPDDFISFVDRHDFVSGAYDLYLFAFDRKRKILYGYAYSCWL